MSQQKASLEQIKLKDIYEQKIANVQKDMNKEFNHKIEVLS
jgi:hypothetical protein